MLIINRLTQIIQFDSNESIDELRSALASSPKLLALLNTSVKHNPVSDDSACIHLFGNTQDKHKFRQLKARLTDKLISHVFTLDNIYSASQLGQEYFRASKFALAANLLRIGNFNIASKEVALKTLRLCEKYEFTDIAVSMSRELRLAYGSSREGDINKFEIYNEKLEYHLQCYLAELEAQALLSRILLLNVTSQRSLDRDEIRQLESKIKYLEKKYKRINTFIFIRFFYQCKIILSEFKGDFANAIRHCRESIEKLSKKKKLPRDSVWAINIRLLANLIKASRLDKAFELAQKIIQHHTHSEHGRLVAYLYYFILCIQSKSYDKAAEALVEAKSQKGFNKLPPNLKQLWIINEAYIQLLIKRGKINAADFPMINPRSFRLYKFLNEVPIYEKDKRGVNVAILILHVMFLLDERKFGKIHDRVEALQQYSYRHLRRDETFRSNCFIKMLVQITKADFNRLRTERYAKKYTSKLLAMPTSEARQNIEMEVMPYEHMWELALEMLD